MSYSIPKKASAYLFYVGLSDQSNTKVFKANPTLAAGDFKISKDGGALVNLTNLPTVTPAAGVLVQVSLTASEMNADTVTLVFSDAAGAEWCDLVVMLQTTALQTDDLMPLASYAAPDNTGISAIKAKTDLLPADPASNTQVNTRLAASGYTAPDNADIATILTRTDVATSTRSTYAGTDTAGTATLLGRVTGAVPLATDYTHARAIKLDNLDAAVSSRNAVAPDNTDIAAIKAKTDNLPGDPASNTHVDTRLAAADYVSGGGSTGSAPTVAEVVAGVWNEPSGAHLTAGTTGNRLNAAASGAGSGPIQWVYTLTDVATHLPVAQAYIWATTDAIGSNIVAQGLTDNFGVVTFYLSAGTYYIWRVKAGWIFANPDTEVVA